MRIRFVILLLISCFLACTAEKGAKPDPEKETITAATSFDKEKWNLKKGKDYLYRDQMLHDIVYNDTVRSLNKSEIIALLGEPDKINEGHLYYQISQNRIAFWPLHTTTLVIKIREDDSIDWIKIHE